MLHKIFGNNSSKHSVTNKVYWITGASSGLGKALAFELASKGAKLVLSGRNVEELQKVSEQCAHTDTHLIVPFDITDTRASEQACAQVLEHFGRIDCLINNAGVSQRSLIMETNPSVEQKVMDIDFFAQTNMTRQVLPSMLAHKSGKIVMISSVAGLVGTQYRGGYSAAKAALYVWGNSLRAELYDQGIDVANVFPGFVRTNVSLNALTANGSTQGTMDEQTAQGLSPTTFAKQTVAQLQKGNEHIVVGGSKEKLAAFLYRVSPMLVHKLIRKNDVT